LSGASDLLLSKKKSTWLSGLSTLLELSMLESFFQQADVPGEHNPMPLAMLQYYALEYQIGYAELFGESPEVKTIRYTPSRFMLPGRVNAEAHRNNSSDWDDAYPLSLN
jgi:hypothetical protein